VIAIDRFGERLRKAQSAGAETLDYSTTDIPEALREMTGGRGPDACIDAVGMEAHVHGPVGVYDRTKQALRLQTERPGALRQAVLACRNGGTVSVPGVYGGMLDKMPFGSIVNKALTIRSGQTHVQRYMKPLLQRIVAGEIDPSFIVTHRLGLDDAPAAYEIFKHKEEECIKVVLKPGAHVVTG
jgi:threonine dehydrogenase-like Zn-dependent dehydrogenase